MADEQLIEVSRRKASLWQVSSISYKDLWAKENAWKEVAEEVKFIHKCIWLC